MLRDTWFGHILHQETGHKIMRHKQDLIKKAITSIEQTRHFFRFSDYAIDSWFFDYICPDFGPINDFLRIGFKHLADPDKKIIIASAFPVKRGVISYEPVR